ncbi:hypothetical protein GCM10023084_02950 [Streptomyces lacrimifluminis]|uniref:hypothetical protein n=1 Tax=Streptomyces lacrimifluminis TaxID=1500077 RepID=UPI0031E56DF7
MTERPADGELARQRKQLIEAMSGVSEERWCAGWLHGLEQRLHEEGGIWETIGRSTGWPIGDYGTWTWFPWDEAAQIFARTGP